jgi:tetratricopeptide (TPR) repeat protein
MTGILIVLSVLAAAGLATFIWQRRRATRRFRVRSLATSDRKLAAGEYANEAEVLEAQLASEDDQELLLALRTRLARALVGAERYDDAVRVCSDAVESSRTPAERADALVERARCSAAMGAFDDAASDATEARRLGCSEATRIDLELVTADIALALRNLDAAERALGVASTAAGQGARASEVGLGHARLQLLRGGFRQCVAEINRILEDLTGDDLQALALVTTARALLELERPDVVGADGALTRAALIVHHQGVAAVVLATCALAQAHSGNATEAVTSASCAPGMTKSPRYATEAHCIVGDTFLVMHRVAEARASFQTALIIDSSCPEALLGLGRCAQDFGLFEVAEGYYRLCLAAAPGHYAAHRAEAALER